MGFLFTDSLSCAALSVITWLFSIISEVRIVWFMSFDFVCLVVGIRDPSPTRHIFCVVFGLGVVFDLLLWVEVFFGDIFVSDGEGMRPGRLLLFILCFSIYMMYKYSSYYPCVDARRICTMLS